MIEIRREDDGELCGFVEQRDDGWHSLAVFGATIAVHETSGAAEAAVRAEGLASLAERWTLLDRATGREQIVCIHEADPDGVMLALDYYSLPGVPTLRIPRSDLADGNWTLRRH